MRRSSPDTGSSWTRGCSRRATRRWLYTRHAALARLSQTTAQETGVKDGDLLAVTGPAGSVHLPLQVTPMPDRVVWLPLNSTGGGVAADTGAQPGDLVKISAVPGTPAPAEEVDA